MEVGGGGWSCLAGMACYCITIDVLEPKPVSTRKLRRRANDPIPIPEKRRKAVTYILLVQSVVYI